MLLPVPRTADYKRIDVYIAARRPVHPCDRGNSCARRVALQHVRAHADIGRGTRVINIVRVINICVMEKCWSPSHKPISGGLLASLTRTQSPCSSGHL